MPGTFTQLQIHIVFAVKYRRSLINPAWENELFKYITGIVHNKGHRLIAINGMPDHIHILIGHRPHEAISDLVREIKKSSTNYLNSGYCRTSKFQWQEGYGAFSVDGSRLQSVIRYIHDQKMHHTKINLTDEYTRILRFNKIEFKPEYLFSEPLAA